MIRSACQQMTRVAAILAVALLCAQTLVVIHDHHLSDGVLCAVCSTPAEHAASSGIPATATPHTAPIDVSTRTHRAPAAGAPTTRRARAPPTA
jgi:hypothetical protein